MNSNGGKVEVRWKVKVERRDSKERGSGLGKALSAGEVGPLVNLECGEDHFPSRLPLKGAMGSRILGKV